MINSISSSLLLLPNPPPVFLLSPLSTFPPNQLTSPSKQIRPHAAVTGSSPPPPPSSSSSTQPSRGGETRLLAQSYC